MRPDVLIAAELRELISDDALGTLAVHWLPDGASTPSGAFRALIPLLSRRVGATELDGLPALRIVANCAVGVDNIDLAATERRGVIVTNTPGVLTDATADLTWGLILAVARRLKEGQRLIAEGKWRGWHPTLLLGLELAGRTLGIVGAGRIGRAVAARAAAFRMRVLYVSPTRKPDLERDTGASRVDLYTLLRQSDVVSLHVPASDETRNLLDRERLALLKEGAILINTARGELVHEEALVEALDAGRLGGVGLDVFANEPHIPPACIEHPRVVVLPHIGSATTATRRAMAELAVRNVRRVLGGEAPVTPVCR